MKTLTDQELRNKGVDEYLIDYRRELNESIKSGKCYADYFGNKIKVLRAFISNPCGYNKVFLLGENDERIEFDLSLYHA
jgi:hypothetical protein